MDNVNRTSATPETLLDAWGLSNIGACYLFGGVGGSFYHFLKATRNSPSGQRFINAIHCVRTNAPPAAGAFAFWGGGVHFASVSALEYLRQKDDTWNSPIGATVTGMLYKRCQGFRPACKMGLRWGAIAYITNSVLTMLNDAADGYLNSMRQELASIIQDETHQ